jgi:hypothetical protein
MKLISRNPTYFGHHGSGCRPRRITRVAFMGRCRQRRGNPSVAFNAAAAEIFPEFACQAVQGVV